MGIDKNKSQSDAAALRRRTNDHLKTLAPKDLSPMTELEIQRLVHELEMQNVELRNSRDEVEAVLEDFTDLYDFAPVSYITINQGGSISAANLTAASFLGIERSRLIGRPFGQFVADESRLNFSDFLGAVIAGQGKKSCELVLLNKAKLTRRVQIDASYCGEKIQCRLALIDISERKRVEEELRESEERQRFFIEYAPAALAMFDPSMRYLAVSRRWLNDYGLENRDLIGLSHYEVFPEIPERWKEIHRRGLAGEVIREEADRFERADGSVQWLRWEIRPWYNNCGAIAGIVIFTEDVSDRKMFEEQLRNSENLYRAIGESIDYGVWVCAPDGRNIYVSESFLKLVGMTQQECSDFGWGSILHPDDAERTIAAWKKCVKTGSTWDFEHRCQGVDGNYHHILARGVPVKDESGTTIYLAGINLDISRIKEIEDKLRHAHDELESRVNERTYELNKLNVQLTQEIEERKKSEESLLVACAEIKQMKDRLKAENTYLQQEVSWEYNFGEIIGQSSAISHVFLRVEQVAPMNATVLLLGETGTGKGVVARAIHSRSTRKDRPMITVNCTSLPANLIESELFGRERGAFTGANERQLGRFELANGGTIFLDEIGEMPLELQCKLLRVIQDGEFERLGSPRTIKTDVRIIAASNRNLEDEIKNGRFREDLFYRLNVFPITIPALRQREGDIPLLINHFVDKFNRKNGKKIETVTKDTLDVLQSYHWPGNVRELESVIERAVITSQGSVLHVLDRFDTFRKPEEPAEKSGMGLVDIERDHIVQVLHKTGWRIEGGKGAAVLLGMNPSTLRARMRKYGIHRKL